MKNKYTALFFSTIVTFSLLFITTLIMSMVAAAHPSFPTGRTPETAFEFFLKDMTFPTFIPAVLLFIVGFALIYPLYEYIKLARYEKNSVLDFQKNLENKFFRKFKTPWNYVAAFLLYSIVFVIIPFTIGYLLINKYNILLGFSEGDEIDPSWIYGIIFLIWLLLTPILYLSYYSRIFTAHIVYRAKYTNLKKDPKTIGFLFFALITIMLTFYSFFQYLPVMWGDTSSLQGYNAPLDIAMIIISSIFFAYLGFYIKFLQRETISRRSIVFFGCYVFIGAAFIIFSNVIAHWPQYFPDDSLQIFGSAIDFESVKHQQIFAQMFSVSILVEKFMKTFLLIRFLFFSESIKQSAKDWVLNRSIMKNDFDLLIKQITDSDPLNRINALQSIISYIQIQENMEEDESQHFSQVVGFLLLDEDPTVISILNKNIGSIAEKLTFDVIFSSISNILMAGEEEQKEKLYNLMESICKVNPDKLFSTFQRFYQIGLPSSSKKLILNLLKDVSFNEWDKPSIVIRKGEGGGVVAKLFFSTYKWPSKDEELFIGLLDIMGDDNFNLDNQFPDLDTLIDGFKYLLESKSDKIINQTIKTFSLIIIQEPFYYDTFMEEFNQITDSIEQNVDTIVEKINAIQRLIIIFPNRFEDLFHYFEKWVIDEGNAKKSRTKILTMQDEPYIASISSPKSPFAQESSGSDSKQSLSTTAVSSRPIKIKCNIALALGKISWNIDSKIFFERVFPYLLNLIKEPSYEIKETSLQSMIEVSKIIPQIRTNHFFQMIIGKLLIEPDLKLRQQVYEFINQQNIPLFIIRNFKDYISDGISLEIRMEFINIMINNMKQIYKFIKNIDILDVLIAQEPHFYEKIRSVDFFNTQTFKTKYFGIKLDKEELGLINYQYELDLCVRSLGEISYLGAILALIYEFCKYQRADYSRYGIFVEEYTEQGGTLAQNKMLDFQTNIILSNKKSLRSDGDLIKIGIAPMQKLYSLLNPIIQKQILEFLTELYNITPEFHQEIFENTVALLHYKNILHQPAYIIKIYIALICKIISDNPMIYFRKMRIKLPPGNTYLNIFPFDEYVHPILKDIMNMDDDGIQNAIVKVFNEFFQLKFLSKYMEKRIYNSLIKNTIFEVLQETQIKFEKYSEYKKDVINLTSAKKTAINLLLNSPFEIFTDEMFDIILNLIIDKKRNLIKNIDPDLKSNIINLFNRILMEYKEFPIKVPKEEMVQFNKFNELVSIIYGRQYQTDAEYLVKNSIVIGLSNLVMRQPQIKEIINIIFQVCMDPSPEIASKAIMAYFKFYILRFVDNPDIYQNLVVSLEHFSNHTNLMIKQQLLNWTLTLYELGVKYKAINPILLKLLISQDRDIQRQSMGSLIELYERNKDKNIVLMNTLINLTMWQNVEIQRDATIALINFILNDPERVKDRPNLFKHLRDLAQDDEIKIRRLISSSLNQLIASIPSKSKEILHIIYPLIEDTKKEIKQDAIVAIKKLFIKFTEHRAEIYENIGKIYRKTEDGMLLALHNELKPKSLEKGRKTY